MAISNEALVLVAVMPARRDLEIARLLGWYRIPLRFAPKVVDVDYLAFYQTAAFGEEDRWKIRFIAEARGHELTTRGELLRDEADHPRACEEYFKIQIGPLLELVQPILADQWRRITFFYTTGEYLNRAKSLNDLVVHSEERDVLWSTLRERALLPDRYHIGSQPLPDLNPELLELLGVFGLKKDNPIDRLDFSHLD